MANNLKLAIEIKAVDVASKVIKKLYSNIADLSKANDNAARSYRGLASSVTSLGTSMLSFKYGITAAIQLEKSQTNLKSLLVDNTSKFHVYNKEVHDAASTFGGSIPDYMKVSEYLERSGTSSKEIGANVKTIGMLAQNAGLKVGDISVGFINLKKAFGTKDVEGMAAALNKVDVVSTEGLPTVQANMLAVATQAKLAGISINEVATAQALLAQATGSSDVRGFMDSYIKYGKGADGKMMGTMNFLKEYRKLYQETVKQGGEAQAYQRFRTMFDENTIAIFAKGNEEYDAFIKRLEETATIQKRNEEVNKTFGASWGKLTNNITNTAANIYTRLLPSLTSATNGVTTFINSAKSELSSNQKDWLSWGLIVSTAVAGIAGAKGGLGWLKGLGKAKGMKDAAPKGGGGGYKQGDWIKQEGKKTWRWIQNEGGGWSKETKAGSALKGLKTVGKVAVPAAAIMEVIGVLQAFKENQNDFGGFAKDVLKNESFGLIDIKKGERKAWDRKVQKGEILSEYNPPRSGYNPNAPANILNSASSQPAVEVKINNYIEDEKAKSVRQEQWTVFGGNRGGSLKPIWALNQ